MRLRELIEAPDSNMSSIFGKAIDQAKDIEAGIDPRTGYSFDAPSGGGVNSSIPSTGEPNNPGSTGGLRFSSSALTTLNGSQSRMTKSSAGQAMAATIRRAENMARIFGGTITVNDAIAKSGTSRERETQGSQHFNGTALDLSTAGMDNATKLRLVAAAQRAGFTGFGFGNSILHVDTGPRRHWSYGNSSFAGVSVASLGRAVRNNQIIGGTRAVV